MSHATIACPVCRTEHRGPRDVEIIHHEILRFTQRAAEMPMVEAAAYLRVNLLAAGFELSAFCPNCTVNAQASITCSVSSDSIAAVRETDAQLQAVAGEAPVHVCTVIGMDAYRNRPKALTAKAIQEKNDARSLLLDLSAPSPLLVDLPYREPAPYSAPKKSDLLNLDATFDSQRKE